MDAAREDRRPDARRTLGTRGEELTAERYRADGYEILSRNWRCRQGELDLVLHRDRVLVFCEVKTRRSDRFGSPIEAITREKRQRIRVLAGRWLDEHKPIVREVRFDVASVTFDARRAGCDRRDGGRVLAGASARFRVRRRAQHGVCQWRRRSAASSGITTSCPVPGRISWSQPGHR